MNIGHVIAIVIALLLAVSWRMVYRQFRPKSAKPNPDKKKIACIGDSITFGAGVPLHQKTQSYPAFLQKLIPENWQVLNYGLSGRTLLAEGDSPYVKELFFRESHAVHADLYIMMLGTTTPNR